MNTSAKNTTLSEVRQLDVLSPGTRAYFQARTRNRLYNLVLSRFRREAKKGLTKAELARRLGKKPEVVNRLLGAPGNWTIDTLSDLLLGISGEELDATATPPLSKPARNYTAQDALRGTECIQRTTEVETAPTTWVDVPRRQPESAFAVL